MRPVAKLEVDIGTVFKADSNFGAKDSVQVSLKTKYPAFEAVTERGVKLRVLSP